VLPAEERVSIIVRPRSWLENAFTRHGRDLLDYRLFEADNYEARQSACAAGLYIEAALNESAESDIDLL
jgi:hypothetical protein